MPRPDHLPSVLFALLAPALLIGCRNNQVPPQTPNAESTPSPTADETRAIAARQACYARLVRIDAELVGHVVALESGSPCASNNDCIVVDVKTSCLSSCPNVIARSDMAELTRRLAASESQWCRGPTECTMQSLCAPTTAVCDAGRCRARWDGVAL